MNLKFIGTGDAFTKSQGHNSAIFMFDNTNLMIDCPHTNYTNLASLKLGFENIENVFISHLHADHINGLETFAFFRKFATPNLPKPNLYISEELINDLWRTLRSGLEFLYDGIHVLEDYFNVKLIKEEFMINNISFKIIKTDHMLNMLSYGLLAEDYFYFSCDSNIDTEFLIEIHNKVDYIFHDCHFHDVHIASHPSLKDIKKLSNEIINKIVLMHYDDRYTKNNIKKQFEIINNVKLAKKNYKYKFKVLK
jgi:ribonuclease BN (tRNA processing enzyme)